MLKQSIYPDDPRYLAELSNWYMNEDICSHDFLYQNQSLLFWWGDHPAMIREKDVEESMSTGTTIVVTLRNDLNPKEPPVITKAIACSPSNLHALEVGSDALYRQMANMVTLLVGAETYTIYKGRMIPRGPRRGEIIQMDIYPTVIPHTNLSSGDVSEWVFQTDLTPTMTWVPEIPYHFPVRFGFRDVTSDDQVQREIAADAPSRAVIVDMRGNICNQFDGPQNGKVQWYRSMGY